MSTEYFVLATIAILTQSGKVSADNAEPVCSKFDYEIKTLEAMLRIEQRVEKMTAEFKEMKHGVSEELEESKELRSTLKIDLERFKSSIVSEMANTKTELQDQMNILVQKEDPKGQENNMKNLIIAFSVTNPTKSLVDGVPTFKTVITNIGDGYNVQTGVFTSPVDGLFLFLFTVGSNGKHNVHCRIQHNGQDKVLGLTYSDTGYTTASAVVNLLLEKGDTVRLGKCYQWSHVYTTSPATSFSGVLITKTGMK